MTFIRSSTKKEVSHIKTASAVCRILMVAAAMLACVSVQAATIHREGEIAYHNDVVTLPFVLEGDSDSFRLWTDSFQDGQNFDPRVTLWAADGGLLYWNDDDASIQPETQTGGDAGLYFHSIPAGNYILTLTLSDNPAMGGWLNEGFLYSNAAGVPLSSWASAGGHWSVWMEADTLQVSSIPEPSLPSLFMAGLLACAACRRLAHGKR